MVSIWHTSSRTCVISRGKVSLLDRYQTQIFLALTSYWDSGNVSLLASKNFSNVVATSHSSCFFLYLFSSANISPVRFVLHLQDWWCVGKRETSFPINKLWLIYLPPSLWPLTLKNRYYNIYFYLTTTSGRPEPECALRRVMSSEPIQDEQLTRDCKQKK